MTVLFGIVVGIVSLRWWPEVPEPLLVLGILAFLFSQRQRIPPFLIGLTFGCLVALSAVTLHLYKTSYALTVVQDTTIAGKVGSLFTGENQQTNIIFDVDTVNGRKLTIFETFRIRLYWRADQPVKQGQHWSLTARIREPYGRVNEAGFDAETYFLAKHIHAKGTVLSASLVDETVSWRQALFDLVFPTLQPFKNSQYLTALAFGERSLLTDADWEGLRNTGLAHLLAISGLHIGLAFAFGYSVTMFALALVSGSGRGLWLPVVIGLLTALSYAWLAGFSLTAQRALIALMVFSAIRLAGFSIGPFRMLLLVLAIVLALDPLSVFSVSFWLSFGAVFVICLMTLTSQQRANPVAYYFRQLLRMQCFLLLGMLPLMWLWFGGVSLYGLFCNLVAVPIVSLLTVPAILMAILSEMLFPATWLWQLADASLSPVSLMLNHADAGWLTLHAVPLPFILVLLLIFVAVTYLSSRQRTGLVAALLVVLLCWRAPKSGPNAWRVDVLDVGHGLAVLIEKGGQAVLYDTGAAWPSGSVAGSVIAPMLVSRDVILDGVIISHTDNDHAGGLDWIAANLAPEWVRASEQDAGFLPCKQGESWQWQSLRFEVLSPPEMVDEAQNEDSCVIRLSDGQHTILLTGDLPKQQEQRLIEEGTILGAEVLLVPHHGSKTSSSEAFIAAVNPSVAIASTGRYTPWDLPHPAVVERYRERGISWYETGQHGQVSVHFSDKGWRVSSQRFDSEPFWYRKMFGPPKIKE